MVNEAEIIGLYEGIRPSMWLVHKNIAVVTEIGAWSIASLPDECRRADKAIKGYTVKGVCRQKPWWMDASQLLQRLAFLRSKDFEVGQEKEALDGCLSEEDMVIRFIKEIVLTTMRHNSWWGLVGIDRILHDYSTLQSLRMYDLLAPNRAGTKDDAQAGHVKAKFMDRLKVRFPQLTMLTAENQEKRFAKHGDQRRFESLVARCLRVFTPAATTHLGSSAVSSFTGGSPFAFQGAADDEHEVERLRAHTIVCPECFEIIRQLCEFDSPSRHLWVPYFGVQSGSPGPEDSPSAPDGGNGGTEGDDNDQFEPPPLGKGEIPDILRKVDERLSRRRKIPVRAVSVLVDGVERGRFAVPGFGIRIALSDGDDAIQIKNEAKDGEILATHFISRDDLDANKQVAIATVYSLEASEVSLVFPTQDLNAGQFVVDVSCTASSPSRETIALRSLTTSELLRLKHFAQWRIRGLGRKAGGRTDEDLLAEAITATLSGQRSWREDIDLCQHLLGAMRSISTRWRAKKEPELYFEAASAEFALHANRADHSVTNITPERIVMAKERFEKIVRLFRSDPLVSQILQFVCERYTGEEIRSCLNLSERSYNAATKRMRRRIRALRY